MLLLLGACALVGVRAARFAQGALPDLLSLFFPQIASCETGDEAEAGSFSYRAANDWRGHVSEQLRIDGKHVGSVRHYTVKHCMTPSRYVHMLQDKLARDAGCHRMAWQHAGTNIGLAVLASMAEQNACNYTRGSRTVSLSGTSTGGRVAIHVHLVQGDHLLDHVGLEMPSNDTATDRPVDLSCEEVQRALFHSGWLLMPHGNRNWRRPLGVAVDEHNGLALVREFGVFAKSAAHGGRAADAVGGFLLELMGHSSILEAAISAAAELFRLTSVNNFEPG